MNSNKNKTELVIIGGGFAGIRLIHDLKNTNFNLTLIDKNNYHTFQPLLYQVASGGLGADSIAYPFRRIFKKYKNFKFKLAEVIKINPEANEVITKQGDVKYDILVIANGSTSNYFGNKNIESAGMPMKSVTDALNIRSEILQNLEMAINISDIEEQKKLLNFVLVGGGATGVEMAGALAEFKNYIAPIDYPDLPKDLISITLVEGADALLSVMSKNASKKSFDYLKEMGVDIKLNAFVSDYNNDTLKLSNGDEIKSKTIIWSAGVKGAIIEGLANDSIVANRYIVDEYNKIKGLENIYAVGDVACMITDTTPKGHPMVAGVAVQQADNLARNLLNENRKVKFSYFNKGVMATIGKNKAVVDLSFIKFQGVFAWFIWMFVHLMLLVGFRNRVVVFFDWAWNYITYERSFRLIIRPYKKYSCRECAK